MMKPQITTEKIQTIINSFQIDLKREKCVLIGIRGYFLNSMGKPSRNDIGMYDDAFVWISKDGDFATFNGNTDPSRYYQNVATLKAGVWNYKKGKHGVSKPGGGYPAFRQAGPVKVLRYQANTGKMSEFPLGDTINIHRGGKHSTSSAGCQTLPPDQWEAFKAYGYSLLSRYEKPTFKYILMENDGNLA
jgi:hypothetical protein